MFKNRCSAVTISEKGLFIKNSESELSEATTEIYEHQLKTDKFEIYKRSTYVTALKQQSPAKRFILLAIWHFVKS